MDSQESEYENLFEPNNEWENNDLFDNSEPKLQEDQPELQQPQRTQQTIPSRLEPNPPQPTSTQKDKLYYTATSDSGEEIYSLEITSASSTLKRIGTKDSIAVAKLFQSAESGSVIVKNIDRLSSRTSSSSAFSALFKKLDGLIAIINECGDKVFHIGQTGEELDADNLNILLKDIVRTCVSVSDKLRALINREYTFIVDFMLAEEDQKLGPADIAVFFTNLNIENADKIKIDQETLVFLNITKEDPHPSMIKGKGKSKEGYSLFSRISSTLSMPIARPTFRELLLNPISEVPTLKGRLRKIEAFGSIGPYDRKSFEQNLSGSNILKGVMERVLNQSLSLEDWIRLPKWLGYLTKSLDMIAAMTCLNTPSIKVNYYFVQVMSGLVGRLLAALSGVIDPMCQDELRLVKQGVSVQLDDARTIVNNFSTILATYEAKVVEQVGTILIIEGIVYLPEIGYLITADIPQTDIEKVKNTNGITIQTPRDGTASVRASQQEPQQPNQESSFSTDLYQEGKLLAYFSEISLPESLCFIFERGGKLFFKSPITQELDEKFGNIRQEALMLQDRVLMEMRDFLMEYEPLIQECLHVCIDVDINLALGRYLKEGMSIPKYSSESATAIASGGHVLTQTLLEQLKGEEYRRASYGSADEDREPIHPRIMFLFGPNGSGKSHFAKMVGLNMYSAYVGLPVLAKEMVVCPLNQILAYESPEDSSNYTESSFTQATKNFLAKLSNCESKSLILVDEFTRGASPHLSIALTKTVSDIILSRHPAYKGHCIICSHQVELLSHNFMPRSAMVRAFKMNYLIEDDDIYFLYRPVPTTEASSMSLYLTKQIVNSPLYIETLTHYLKHGEYPPLSQVGESAKEAHTRVCSELLDLIRSNC